MTVIVAQLELSYICFSHTANACYFSWQWSTEEEIPGKDDWGASYVCKYLKLLKLCLIFPNSAALTDAIDNVKGGTQALTWHSTASLLCVDIRRKKNKNLKKYLLYLASDLMVLIITVWCVLDRRTVSQSPGQAPMSPALRPELWRWAMSML